MGKLGESAAKAGHSELLIAQIKPRRIEFLRQSIAFLAFRLVDG
jgi:hypothetical protein